MRNLITSISLVTVASACASDEPRPEPPILKVTSPQRGLVQSGLEQVEVRGTVTPSESGLEVGEVEVNGVDAQVSPDGSWVARVPIAAGTTLLETVAKDVEGNAATDTRGVMAGNLMPLSAEVADGLAIAISDQAFAAIGVMAGNIIKMTDLGAVVAPMNPMISTGAEDGEDCLFAKANINDIDISDASIDLVPYSGGLRLTVEVLDLRVPVYTWYAVACVDGDTDVVVNAQRITIQGDLNLSVANGQLVTDLTNENVEIVGFDLQANGLAGTVIDMLSLDTRIGPILALGVEKFMGPMVEDALAGLSTAGPLSLPVMGKTLEVEIHPGSIEFDVTGAKVRLDTRFTMAGAESAPGFVFTQNGLPQMAAADGFELAMADDSINQLLTGFWAVGGLNMTMPMSVGGIEEVSLEALLPPMVMAGGTDGKLKIVVGDMIMTKLVDGVVYGKNAVSMEIELAVDSTGRVMKLDVGEPEIHADLMDDVPNLIGLTDDEEETIMNASVHHMMDTLGPLLQSIPLPSLAGVVLSDLDIKGVNGYVTITGVLLH
jgi:hypothetical protein